MNVGQLRERLARYPDHYPVEVIVTKDDLLDGEDEDDSFVSFTAEVQWIELGNSFGGTSIVLRI